MQKSLHVYVCSTYRDLVSERNAVVDGLEDLSSLFPALTFFCPRSIQTLDACKDEISRSDLLVLIVGHLQGVIAPGMDISHGEAEYNEGISLDIPVLVYFRDEKVGLYPIHFERDRTRAKQLKEFKDKLESRHETKVFSGLHSLVNLVTEDVSKLARQIGLETNHGPRNTRYKGKTWVTRKMPVVNGATLLPESSSDHQTRTIPIFQKALATPFRRRKSGTGRMGKTVILAMMLIVVAGVSLSKLHKLPLSPTSHFSLGTSGHGNTPEGSSSAGNPSADVAGENPAMEPSRDPAGIPAVATTAPLTAQAPGTTSKPPKHNAATVVLMDDGDSTKAFLRKATDGSPADQFQVGAMYEQGKDVPRSDSLALHWYRKAAEKGLAEAQYKVALMYRSGGKGVPRSSFQAVRWFQAAAEQGHPQAQVKLGQMYQSGKGVSRNETVAFKWFLKAADQKDPEAEKILAGLRESQ